MSCFGGMAAPELAAAGLSSSAPSLAAFALSQEEEFVAHMIARGTEAVLVFPRLNAYESYERGPWTWGRWKWNNTFSSPASWAQQHVCGSGLMVMVVMKSAFPSSYIRDWGLTTVYKKAIEHPQSLIRRQTSSSDSSTTPQLRNRTRESSFPLSAS